MRMNAGRGAAAARSWTRAVLVAAGLCIAVPWASAEPEREGPESAPPRYHLRTRVEPALRRIDVEACAEGGGALRRFALHRDARIRRVTAGGAPATFRWDAAAPRSHYAPTSGVVAVDGAAAGPLCVEYEATYPTSISSVNQVAPDLVELASYAAWYPRFEGVSTFSFELEADLPAELTVVVNGVMVSERVEGARQTTVWVGGSASDVVLIASPGLRQVHGEHEGTRVELYFSRLTAGAAARLRDALVEGMARLTGWYGRPATPGLLRIVYSPRSGWGYSRAPLFVMSEQYAEEQSRAPMGEAQVLHGSFHEMAHFWWNVASRAQGDDWLNEGLAEFSALRLSRAVSGTAFGDRATAEYRAHAAASREEVAIAETPDGSPDRYVNRYEKSTLLLDEVARRCGPSALDGVLTHVHTAHAVRRDLTTATFLERVQEGLGEPARCLLERVLFEKRWSEDLLATP